MEQEVAARARHNQHDRDHAGRGHHGRGHHSDVSLTLVVAPGFVLGKRLFDIIVGAVLCMVSLPIQVACLTMSAVTFHANPVFVQSRVGRYGEIFRFVKIRSLPPQSPAEATKYELVDIALTPVGSMLRRTHADESIQLWSVVTGQLSLVGPRPEMTSLEAVHDPQFRAIRQSVRPGITGAWQVSEACDGLIHEAPEYDSFYVANRSWKLDLWLLWRTFLKISTGRRVSFDELQRFALSSR